MDDSCVSVRIDSGKDLDTLSGKVFVSWHRLNGCNQSKKVPATIQPGQSPPPAGRPLRPRLEEPMVYRRG